MHRIWSAGRPRPTPSPAAHRHDRCPAGRGPRVTAACVAAAAAVLMIAGCGDEQAGQATVAPAPVTTALPASDARVTVPPSLPAAEQAELAEVAAQIRPFLLAPEEIGPGFTAGPDPQPDPAAPAICGGPGVVAQFPRAVRVGASATGPAEGMFVQQTLSLYPDVDTAAVAYRANSVGLACSEGSTSGASVALTPAVDLSVDIPADESTGWQLGGEGFDLVVIAVRSGELVVSFAFVAPADATGDLPDPLAVSRAGVEKLTG